MSINYYSLGLIGYPLEHSYSPLLHGAALEGLGMKGEYRLYVIPPGRESKRKLGKLLQRMRMGEIHGLNVTVPHKQTVIPYMDELSEGAREIGAVNTIALRGGKLAGENTDMRGFIRDMERVAHRHLSESESAGKDSTSRKTALILGAGGAARAVCYALGKSGWRLIIAARRIDQARVIEGLLRNRFTGIEVKSIALGKSDIANIEKPIELIVNATPVGMYPNVDEKPWPEGLPFPKGAFVYDLVYNPTETQFLRQAAEEGVPYSGGIGMLIEQAALAFKLWTGLEPPRKLMREAVRNLIEVQDEVSG